MVAVWLAVITVLFLVLTAVFTTLQRLALNRPVRALDQKITADTEVIDDLAEERRQHELNFLQDRLVALEVRRERLLRSGANLVDGSKEDLVLESKILSIDNQIHTIEKKIMKLE